MLRRYWRASMAFVIFAGVAACSSSTQTSNTISRSAQATTQTDGSGDLQSLISAAKKEGSLVWYTGLGTVDTPRVLAKFKEAYPFINVSNFYAANAASLSSRIQAEKSSGKAVADVVSSGDITLIVALKAAGVLGKYDDPEMSAYPKALKDEGYWTTYKRSPLIMAYNPTVINAADAPKKWADLADAKYKGRVTFQETGSGFQHTQWYLLKEKLGSDYWPSVMRNKPVFLQAQAAVQAVLNGSKPLAGMMASYYIATNGVKVGAPMAPVWPEIVPVSNAAMGVLANAPHPNAARLFLHWILSTEGQQGVVDVLNDYPSLPNAPGPKVAGFPPSLSTLTVVSVEDIPDFVRSSEEFTKEWQKYGA
jgi:iron(III) transport system substrate-binding protein